MEKNIAILINCLEFGGAQKIAVSLVKFLEKERKTFLFQLDKDIHPTFIYSELKDKKKLIRLSPISVKSNTILKIIMIPVVLFNLLLNLNKKKVKIVISFMERANIINLMLPLKVKKVISIRNYPSTFYKKKNILKRILNDFGYRFLLKRADIINFNSYESANDFQHLYNIKREKVNVIHNMIDLQSIENLAKNGNIHNKHKNLFSGKIILNVARLTYQKCQTRLIRAFKELSRHVSNVKLLIIGDGPLFKDLRNLIKILDLENNVFLLGFVENPFPYIVRSDIFVLSSSNEGFPNALLEAMALGIPVISTDCSSGPREILAPNTNPMVKTTELEFAEYGILTPSFNQQIILDDRKTTYKEKILSKAMLTLIKKTELRKKYSSLSLKRAKDFSPEKIYTQWKNLINSLENER